MVTLGVLISGVLIFIICVLLLFLLYTTWNFGIFKKMGIKGPPPNILVGNHKTVAEMGTVEADMMWWREYGNVFGHFNGRSPMLVVADPEMLKEILVKQFQNFTDRASPRGFGGDAEENVSSQQGNVWKNSRAILSPTFTAGKLRKMDPLINEAGEALVQHVKRKTKENDEVDFADLFGRYTVEVIASTAFGLKINSQRDPDDKFLQMVSKLIFVKRTSPLLTLAFVIPILARPIAKFFNVSFLNEEASAFLGHLSHSGDLLLSVFVRRRASCVVRCALTFEHFQLNVVIKEMTTRNTSKREYIDFIQLMMEAHNDDPQKAEEKRGLSSKEIIANCLLFFFAGYETTAATLTYMAYLLALHPDVQRRLYDEIVMELGDEEPGYDNVGKLQYMDMCINETMRMFPVAPRTDRTCVQDTEVNGLKVPKGMKIAIPIWILHHSDKLWKNPEKFDPERFTPENKAKLNPYQFMPFGYGPRICIGKRLALTEIKVAMTKILREFEFTTCSKTNVPPKFRNGASLVQPVDMWLRVIVR
ncbi:cytochrome P450 3A24-like [Saccostrea echinata]|uniref:cytochrome P450 3A24-like n=1 Tax=Saccostrea echinata TaxID=191078 RepID=UPI002A7F922E|nr:cytochrome P450 3A24-like [Saccostrea echinata]